MKTKLSILFWLFLFSCGMEIEQSIPIIQPEPVEENQQYYIDFYKYELPPIVADPDIPNMQEKAAIGRKLYFSEIGGVSCASCHKPEFGFTAGEQQSKGLPGDEPGIKSPPSIGLNGSKLLLWNGAAGGLAINNSHSKHDGVTQNNWYQTTGAISQALFAQTAHMQNFPRDSMAEGLMEMFRKAYPGVAENRLCEEEDIAECLAAFQILQLEPWDSRQQQFLRGEINLTKDELIGWSLFDENCEGCHQAPYLGADRFTKTNTPPFINELHDGSQISNLGRYSFTGNEEDKGYFRIMRLQTNIVDHRCWGFSCEYDDLKEFIKDHQSKDTLSSDQVEKVALFLASLRDERLTKISE